MTKIKISKYTSIGECSREDINDLIVGLARCGYNVWIDADYVYFKLGDEDIIEKEEQNNIIKGI